ncbi:MAG: hypothetical protein EXX96DRAFT_540175 [Benjaminiella poitrasii]|nr:MAG: hypothetical protein EXX96DRAFT_540175 [Benjaminiella poitrasii]
MTSPSLIERLLKQREYSVLLARDIRLSLSMLALFVIETLRMKRGMKEQFGLNSSAPPLLNFTPIAPNNEFAAPYEIKENIGNYYSSPVVNQINSSMPSPPCSIPDLQSNSHIMYNKTINNYIQQSPSTMFNPSPLSVIDNVQQHNDNHTTPQQMINSVLTTTEYNNHHGNIAMTPTMVTNANTVSNSIIDPAPQQQTIFIENNNNNTMKQQHQQQAPSQLVFVYNQHPQPNNESPVMTSNTKPMINAKQFEDMSREQLITRLIMLEKEKQHMNTEEDDTEEEVTGEEEETIATTRELTCLWTGCGENFDILQKLITHLTEIHVGGGKATYRCEWQNCPRTDKPFTKRHKMYNHLRTHTGERPFACPKPDCKKRFSRPDSLTTHIKTHSNVRPFVCPFEGCGKAYYHSRSLRKHENVHVPTQQFDTTPHTPTTPVHFSFPPQEQQPFNNYIVNPMQQSPIAPHFATSNQ